MNKLMKRAVKGLLPMLPAALESAFEALNEVPLKAGEERIMLCIYPGADEIMVAPMAVDELGNFTRSIWEVPKPVAQALSELIDQAQLWLKN